MHLHFPTYRVRKGRGGSAAGAGHRRIGAQIVLLWLFLTGACMVQSGAHSYAQDKGTRMNTEHPVIVSDLSDVDVEPDGDLAKPLWSAAKRIRFDQSGFDRTRYPEAATFVASRWTPRYLYLAFWCDYQTLNTYQGEDPGPERWQLWEKDVVESFINPQPDRPSHYYEFEVAPNNQWLDLEIDLTRRPFGDPHWNSGFQHATRVDAARHVWTAEIRIPLAAMTHAALRPESEWRINFYRCDGPGTGKTRRALSWGALPEDLPENSFHQPASFGVLRFVSGGTAPRP